MTLEELQEEVHKAEEQAREIIEANDLRRVVKDLAKAHGDHEVKCVAISAAFHFGLDCRNFDAKYMVTKMANAVGGENARILYYEELNFDTRIIHVFHRGDWIQHAQQLHREAENTLREREETGEREELTRRLKDLSPYV